METIELFREDSYLKTVEATVKEVTSRGGIILDQTIFYVNGGGQPGDQGRLIFDNDQLLDIGATVKDEHHNAIHIPLEDQFIPEVGRRCRLELNWQRRYQLMRMHTALHLLCAVVPHGVTGGQINIDKSRLDFDIEESSLDKDEISQKLQELADLNAAIQMRWITDAELDENPNLVRTMSVQPPRGSGRIRLIEIGENGSVDLQPCGGTHVANTCEIGRLRVSKIENKGKRNRRVNIVLDD